MERRLIPLYLEDEDEALEPGRGEDQLPWPWVCQWLEGGLQVLGACPHSHLQLQDSPVSEGIPEEASQVALLSRRICRLEASVLHQEPQEAWYHPELHWQALYSEDWGHWPRAALQYRPLLHQTWRT